MAPQETAAPALHMDARMARMLTEPGAPPGASYLAYLYAMQQNDYTAAIDHLHRYLDFGRTLRGDARDMPVFQVRNPLYIYTCIYKCRHIYISI